jgi:hypothetical protein
MAVFHWWFVTAPTWIWHAVTPLSFARLIAAIVFYGGYGLATLLVCGYALLGIAKAIRFFGRTFAEGWRKGSAR